MAKPRPRNPVLARIHDMKEEIQRASYTANYYIAKGDRDKAAPFLKKMRLLFAETNLPENVVEDARDTLQRIAAKARKEGIRDSRRSTRTRRRAGHTARKANTKRLGTRVHLVSPKDY